MNLDICAEYIEAGAAGWLEAQTLLADHPLFIAATVTLPADNQAQDHRR